MQNDEFSVIRALGESSAIFFKLIQFHPGLAELSQRMSNCIIEIKDISGEIENLEQKISVDPLLMSKINERLDIIYRLLQKHRVGSIKELIEIMDSFELKLNALTSLDEKIENIKREINISDARLGELSCKISENRKNAIPIIESGIAEVLKSLAIPDGKLKIDRSDLSSYNINGKDKVVFLFNANKGGELKELSKVASGGELSRIMLSIKSLISVNNLLPVIIFDEIDQGVSGEIAGKVGDIMKKMSEKMQVIAITHLPQIAGKGNTHMLVFKEAKGNYTGSTIKILSENERVTEIAKMLSGSTLSNAAIENAKILINNSN